MPTFNKEKFVSLVHYVCDQCRHDPTKLGATKLNKILWLADIYAYRDLGEPITGEAYKKLQFGPVSTHLTDVLSELSSAGVLHIHDVEFHGLEKKQYVTKKRASSEWLSKRQLRLVDDMIKHVCEDHTAATISERTHNELWKMMDMYEEIPYEGMLISFVEPTEEDHEWAREEAAKL